MATIQDVIDFLNREEIKAKKDAAWHREEGHQDMADYCDGLHDAFDQAIWFIIRNCELTKEGE